MKRIFATLLAIAAFTAGAAGDTGVAITDFSDFGQAYAQALFQTPVQLQSTSQPFNLFVSTPGDLASPGSRGGASAQLTATYTAGGLSLSGVATAGGANGGVAQGDSRSESLISLSGDGIFTIVGTDSIPLPSAFVSFDLYVSDISGTQGTDIISISSLSTPDLTSFNQSIDLGPGYYLFKAEASAVAQPSGNASYDLNVNVVPEPSTIAFGVFAFAGLCSRRLRPGKRLSED